jgi:ferredoxin
VSEAPEVFELGDRAAAVTVLDEHPPESLRAQVEQAVKYCPTRAIAIVED